VIPLTNLGAAEDDYLAYGLSEELYDRLTTLRTLRILGQSTTALPQFKSRDPIAMGIELGAELVVTGSLRRVKDQLQIELRVLSTKDRVQVLSTRTECLPASALAVSESLVSALAKTLFVEREPRQSALPTESDTVELYLRARYLYGRSDEVSLEQSVKLFERVLSRAPTDPTLRMSYALTLSRLWFYGNPGAAEKALPAAEAVVEQMPLHGESYLALAGVRFQGADLLGAVQSLGKALTLSPELADAHELLGRILVETGPVREGLARLSHARSLDPGLFRTLAEQARTYALLGDFERAHRVLADPSLSGGSFAIQWILRGRLCLWSRDQRRAKEYLSHPEITQGKFPRARLLLEVAAGFQQIDPQTVLSAGLNSDRSSPRGRTFVFQMHAELQGAYGQPEQAIRSVARSVDAGLADLSWIERCPLLVPLASDLRLAALRRIVYARAYAIREALGAIPPISADGHTSVAR
jgi:TolB-like protein